MVCNTTRSRSVLALLGMRLVIPIENVIPCHRDPISIFLNCWTLLGTVTVYPGYKVYELVWRKLTLLVCRPYIWSFFIERLMKWDQSNSDFLASFDLKAEGSPNNSDSDTPCAIFSLQFHPFLLVVAKLDYTACTLEWHYFTIRLTLDEKFVKWSTLLVKFSMS